VRFREPAQNAWTTVDRVNARPSLWLGRRADDDGPVSLGASTLLRHVMALGSSGSGKTVFCKVLVEEAVRRGIPALCVDPQGDLCSLASGTLSDDELRARGVDPALAAELREKAEVVVLTPGSPRGIPLCADPVDAALASLEGPERIQAVSRTATMVVGLLGFELDGDDGAGLAAVIDRALHDLLASGTAPSLATLTTHLAAAGEEFPAYARYLDPRKIRVACQRLARLDVGARRLLFHDGVPIDVDVLLGRDPRAPVAKGKVRVAVIYLNTLHQQEDKDFFVAALAERLYGWMLANPSATPQALFYIDEVAPFIPPVRKPACKEGLSLLFKQARKYGVCCLMATQNPGDVDYKAMAQFGTWALGRLTTRQDVKKIEPTVKALAPVDADTILGRLPSLKPGELVLLSPDELGAPVELRVRWLATRHETWNEERIEAYADPQRARFAPLIGAHGDAAPAPPPRLEIVAEEELAADAAADDAPPDDVPVDDVPVDDAALDEPAGREPASSEPRAARAERTERDVLDALTTVVSASARELASTLDRSEGTVRRALDRLLERGSIRAFKEGRSQRYWALSTGTRPDLGMLEPVPVLVANVGLEEAARIGATHARTKMLGLVGEEERFERAEPLHRLVYRLDFEERVERPLFARLFGPTHDERIGSVYVHPHNLGVVIFTNDEGIRFEDVPSGPATDIRDFDGVTETQHLPPAALVLEDDDWRKRKPVDAVRERFRARFDATPGRVTPLFVPLWNVLLRSTSGSLRRLTLDALVGRPVRWLPPT
jgi:DNA-binding transcriptional ArsR family regulator